MDMTKDMKMNIVDKQIEKVVALLLNYGMKMYFKLYEYVLHLN